MRKKEIRDLLNRQTDRILMEDTISTAYYEKEDDQLTSLLELAASLKETLVPLANPSLKPRIQETLSNYSKPEIILRRARKAPGFWIFALGAASMISLASILIVLYRRVKSGETQRLGSQPVK